MNEKEKDAFISQVTQIVFGEDAVITEIGGNPRQFTKDDVIDQLIEMGDCWAEVHNE